MTRSGKLVLACAAFLAAVACVFLIAVLVGEGLAQASLWATVLGLPVGLVAASAAVLALIPRRPAHHADGSDSAVSLDQDRSESHSGQVLSGGLVPGSAWRVPPVDPAIVEREELTGDLIRALLRQADGAAVAAPVALVGAGGFGKTMLATRAVHDPRVRRAFVGGGYWVTVGKGVTGALLADKVNDLIAQLGETRPTMADPEQAGLLLGSILDARADTLLVIDGLWDSEQLRPFLLGGRRASRLLVTRRKGIVPDATSTVDVDEMRSAEAVQVLGSGLPQLARPDLDSLLAVTGRWPLLLRLTNRRLRADVAGGVDPVRAARDLAERLAGDGPESLDLSDATSSDQAVGASVSASTSVLSEKSAARFRELAIFVENSEIPETLIAHLWRATGGLAAAEVRRLCEQLADLALVSSYLPHPRRVTLHDVIRAYLRSQLGPQQAAAIGRAFLDAVRPSASPDDPAGTAAWWLMPTDSEYLWRHLGAHLVDGDASAELAMVMCDLRWLGAKAELLGPVTIEADLALVGTPLASSLRRAVGQAAHLLTPIEPAHAFADVLVSRLSGVAELAELVATYEQRLPAAMRLSNRWPVPDQPDPLLLRVIDAHTGAVTGCAAAPDGTWMLTASTEGTAKVWDTATGTLRKQLATEARWLSGCAIAPDGSWAAATSGDGSAFIWRVADWKLLRQLAAHERRGTGCTATADARALITTSSDGTARVWDAATGDLLAVLAGHEASVTASAVSPDGSFAVTTSSDGTARIWGTETWATEAVLVGHASGVSACAVGPDSSWIVTASDDGTARIWDRHGTVLRKLRGHKGPVEAVAVAHDGSWVITAGSDRTTAIWDRARGRVLRALGPPANWVSRCAIPANGSCLVTGSNDGRAHVWAPDFLSSQPVTAGDRALPATCCAAVTGTQLITGGLDGQVRLRSVATGAVMSEFSSHASEVVGCAVSPDGSWCVTAGRDGEARVWDIASGRMRGVLTGHVDSVNACVISDDGNWVLTVGSDKSARIWDAAGHLIRVLLGHDDWVSGCAIGPGGSWLVTASGDLTARIWDASTGACVRTLVGHTGWVSSCAASPDGSWIVTSSGDGTARIWDVGTGHTRLIFDRHRGGITACAVAPDGSMVATASDDRTLRIWRPAGNSGDEAAIRVDGLLSGCCWLADGSGVCAVGSRGTYLFTVSPQGQFR